MTDSFEAFEGTFSAWLRERAEPAWTEATDHQFTRELSAGTLDDAVFRRYLVQDYAFLDSLVSVVGRAVAQAPTMDAKGELAAFLATLTDDENDYFERSFDALNVPDRERESSDIAPVTREFGHLLGHASHAGGYAETLAVLLPAEWVYLTWAQTADGSPERFYLSEWIALHDDPEFAAFVGWLRSEMDRVGPGLSRRRRECVEGFFRETVEREVDFFDAAYGGEP